ncbi:PAS domain-containing protein [Halocalculus aciditolerans]|uniref:PAS domain S-box-containing protein n=1 Tax=Halocalculus aciditolerans TaxID=1383812 RepID=A0A830FJZ3_9EURY|nr:PAS domain-containing protein [Halocalculus aciditolerans]GGL54083.1 hypothetical protein GCM10009039_10330 [Halocalculus aciditolerans]
MDEGIRVLYAAGGTEGEARADALETTGEFDVTAVTDSSAVLDALSEDTVDCLVSEYALDGIDGLGLLNLVRDTDPAIPFVLFVGDGDENVASDAISRGVTDYIQMYDGDDLAVETLANAVRDAAERYQAEQDVAMLNDLARNVYERITDAFFALDRDWRFTYVNPEAERLLDARAEALIGENFWEVFPEAVGTTFYTEYHRAIATQDSVTFDETFPPVDEHLEVRAFPSEDGLSVHFRATPEDASSAESSHLMELTNMLSYDLIDSIRRAQDAVERAKASGDRDDLDEVEAALSRMNDLVNHSVTLASENQPHQR